MFVISDFFPWTLADNTKIASLIQFPWRFLVFVSLLFAFSGAVYLHLLVDKRRRYYLYAILVVFILVQMRFTGIAFQELSWIKSSPDMYISEGNLHDFSPALEVAGAEYIPSQVPSLNYLFEYNKSRVVSLDNKLISSMVYREKGKLRFYTDIPNPGQMLVPLLYYKGYKATLNGRELNIRQSEQGFIEVDVPVSGTVEVWFAGTTIQKVSFFISILSFFLLLIYIGICNRKVKKLQI